MLVEEVPRSFVKKNNSYSHCPLKKRPVHVLPTEEVPEVIKGEFSMFRLIFPINTVPISEPLFVMKFLV